MHVGMVVEIVPQHVGTRHIPRLSLQFLLALTPLRITGSAFRRGPVPVHISRTDQKDVESTTPVHRTAFPTHGGQYRVGIVFERRLDVRVGEK